MPEKPPSTIAFFPEAAYGPALNSVGIAQAVTRLGIKAVFLSDPGFVEVYRGYGFEAHPVNLSEPMPAAPGELVSSCFSSSINHVRSGTVNQSA